MTDRRDTDPEVAPMLSELEETLMELRRKLDDGETGPVGQSGSDNRGEPGRRERPSVPRPPGMREILRFTEQQTIPTLIAILEANIRLLRLAGAALRAVDPERSAVETGEDTAVRRALDAGNRLSTDRLSSGLEELQSALSGTEATNPEARQLLEEAERLSEAVRERIQESEGRTQSVGDRIDAGASEPATSESSGPVHIEVDDATTSTDEGENAEDAEADSGVDVDAELDSIRQEVRGDAEGGDNADNADETQDDEEVESDESDTTESPGEDPGGEDSAKEERTGDEPDDDESAGSN